MKKFRDYRLGKKMAAMGSVVFLLMVGANGGLLYRMNVLKDDLDRVSSRWLPSAVALGNINAQTADFRAAQIQHALAVDDTTKQRLQMYMVGRIESIELNQDAYGRLINTPEQRALYDRFDGSWDRYQEISIEFFELSMDYETDRAIELISRGETGQVFVEIGEILEELVTVNERSSYDAALRAGEMYHRARKMSLLILVGTTLVALILATALVRLITSPVKRLASAAENIALAAEQGEEGNIDLDTVPAETITGDEIGELSVSFNRMAVSLGEAGHKIGEQQRQLRSANAELGDKNRDLEDALEQLKKTQQQLVMREKMASLGNLVAGVAHEINNPVGAVKSAADTTSRSIDILHRALEESPDLEHLKRNRQFHTAVEVLKNNNDVSVTASDRIAEIVRSLKNFARLDEAEFQSADVHVGLDSTLTLLHHRLRNRVEIQKRYGRLPKIQCYPNQLNQVFMNILSNAEQAIADSGTVTISTESAGDHVVVRFTDTGRGIPEHELDQIFDPGFTTKGVGVGTGLGMSISYNIVQKHGGEISVESRPGQGTTVTVTLPVTQDAPAS
jgi:signal transduction histidine kinase